MTDFLISAVLFPFAEPKPGERLPKHDVSNLGIGVAYGHEAMSFPFAELDKGKPIFGISLGG